MLIIGTILGGLGVAAITLLLLQQADRGIWYQTCLFRSIVTKGDASELNKAHQNPFLVPTKILPALLAAVGAGWSFIAHGGLSGLALALFGIAVFSIASTIHAHRALRKLNLR
ncbi:MAG: hypothetical protein HOP95_08640 [Sphingomonas sp.]|nr:hypothetical protein [Sphingomonas sp.]